MNFSTKPNDDADGQGGGSALLRLIDPRLPLPWLVAVIVVAVLAYAQLQALKDAVVELQITVRAGNNSWSSIASDQALLKFRMGNTEEDIKSLRASVAALQSRK